MSVVDFARMILELRNRKGFTDLGLAKVQGFVMDLEAREVSRPMVRKILLLPSVEGSLHNTLTDTSISAGLIVEAMKKKYGAAWEEAQQAVRPA